MLEQVPSFELMLVNLGGLDWRTATQLLLEGMQLRRSRSLFPPARQYWAR
ncbi:MAG: hypothetical protein M3P85_02765 [Actinomycetota bacterium]|nr:hypothetical protein [Actinomycetota bacterium]